jgi:hypothetical protein
MHQQKKNQRAAKKNKRVEATSTNDAEELHTQPKLKKKKKIRKPVHLNSRLPANAQPELCHHHPMDRDDVCRQTVSVKTHQFPYISSAFPLR